MRAEGVGGKGAGLEALKRMARLLTCIFFLYLEKIWYTEYAFE